ncbi:MAG: AI-2E family transporter [Anaerolineales bacterium]|nr:AI-2E family transporter [Anaerolineales bacterium]
MTENWSQPFRYWILTVLAVSFAILTWLFRDMIKPLVFAALIAYVLNPVVNFLADRTRLSRPAMATIVFLFGLIVVVILPVIMLPTLLTEIQILAADFQEIIAQAQDMVSQPVLIFDQELHLGQLLPDFTEMFSRSIVGFSENIFHFLETATKNLLWILIILAATYYLLRDWALLRKRLSRFVPEQYLPDARRLYSEIKLVWRGYLRGNLVLMLIVGVVFSLAWVIIGVPGALVLGIIAGILTIIPDLGPAIAAGLAVVVALFEGSTYLQISNIWFAILVASVYMVLINIKNIWLRPRIFSRGVHMHEGIVFVAIMVAVLIQGILGALIIVPLLASISIVGNYTYRRIRKLPPWPDVTLNDRQDGESPGENQLINL